MVLHHNCHIISRSLITNKLGERKEKMFFILFLLSIMRIYQIDGNCGMVCHYEINVTLYHRLSL